MARTQDTVVVAWLIICFAIGSSVARSGSNGNRMCSSPPTIELAYPDGNFDTSLPSGTTVSYQCTTGYATHGDTRVHCINMGLEAQWTKPRFSCHPILCDPPQRPDNGQLMGTDHSFRQTITYACDQGYQMWSTDEELLTETPKSVCTADGTWTSEMPLCKPVVCQELGALPHGAVEVPNRTYKNKASYRCAAGYHLVGNDERRCLENGEWSGSQPTCEEIKEELPILPTHPYYKPNFEDGNDRVNKPEEKEKSWLQKEWQKVKNFLKPLCFWCKGS